MRKASKILLLVWDILLIPVIIGNAVLYLSFNLETSASVLAFLEIVLEYCSASIFIFAGLSMYFIPQIISLGLIVLNFPIPFRFWEPTPTKKDIIQRVLLSVLAIIGAICAFYSVLLLSDGNGVPIS